MSIGGRILPKLLETEISLGPGQEQDYGPYQYYQGGTVRLITASVALHYAGVFDEPQYRQFRATGLRAPFPLGTARAGNRLEYQTTGYGRFYVVVRKSLLNLGFVPIRVTLEYG